MTRRRGCSISAGGRTARSGTLQRELHARVADGREPDTWIVVEHDPVVTLGRNAKRENLLLSPDALARARRRLSSRSSAAAT